MKNSASVLIAVIAFALVTLGLPATNAGSNERIRYVAIGDSYSIGEGAKPNEAWPTLLTQQLKAQGVDIKLMANPSRTGWTAQQAIDRELPVFVNVGPNFATLQIGVNDWVQGVTAGDFRQRLIRLMDRMLEVLGKKNRLLIVTIPDFGVTPTGARYARGRNISEGIASFNRIIDEESAKRGLRVVDVYELSKKMKGETALIAADGLHPSAREYAEWEKVIFPVAQELLMR